MVPGTAAWLLLALHGLPALRAALSPTHPMDPAEQEEKCRNFTVGSPSTNTFFSPAFPKLYPRGIKCSK
jgi:hypothetical protein